MPAGSRDQRGEAVRAVAEAHLTGAECASIAAATLIGHRQQGQADAGGGGGGDNARRHLGGIGIGRSVGVVVQVVELGDGAVAGFQHLHLHEAGNRLDIIGSEPLQKLVHQCTPCPEAVASAGATGLAQASESALECMAVQVDRRRQKNAETRGGAGLGIRLNRGNAAVGVDIDAHAIGPAVRQ